MTLQSIRDRIDQLDLHLVELLNERMRLVADIGKLKRERGQSVFAPEREELLLQNLEKVNPGPLGQIGLRAIYREILSASRANQSKLRIVYLGEEHSPDFLAARMRFGASDFYRAEPDWKGAVKSLEKKEGDVAVVPRAVLLQALAQKSGEKHFTRSLRVCGEINLLREVQSDTSPPADLQKWRGPQQFFILTHGGESHNPEGKSLLYLRSPLLKNSQEELTGLIARHGGSLQSAEAVTVSGERYLCEVTGALNCDQLLAETSRKRGRQVNLVLLGTYPTPPLYG
jgi:chorismate mutase